RRPRRRGARHPGHPPPGRGRHGRRRRPPGPPVGAQVSLSQAEGPYFGRFGGRFVAEALVGALDERDVAWRELREDPAFQAELNALPRTYPGRTSIITEVPRSAQHAGGARVILKREDLNDPGSHKTNNVRGQALLTRKLGKKRVIAETGAGQHGVATA